MGVGAVVAFGGGLGCDFRCRFLVPFALLLELVELVGRFGMGQLKPVVVADASPGEVGNCVFVPLVVIGVWFSMARRGVGGSGCCLNGD